MLDLNDLLADFEAQEFYTERNIERLGNDWDGWCTGTSKAVVYDWFAKEFRRYTADLQANAGK